MEIRSNYSRIAYWASIALIFGSAFFYYPKWAQTRTEATLSWDVSGYYFYLPAFLIYDDARTLSFRDSIIERYQPTPGFSQAFLHQPSGHYVLKYSCGQALQMLPWFLIAHVLAEPLGYPADGFSLPYQAAIGWGSLLIAALGLWFLRRSLLVYFEDQTVAATLLCIAFGTNYLNYTAFDGAMTHNWLFTLYSLLIFNTIQFYKQPSRWRAVLIGLLVGWATLTRPTEIVSVLIPLLWGFKYESISATRRYFWARIVDPNYWLAAVAGGCVILIQPLYWHYVANEWIIYSYEEQGFSWLHPHILDGLFSFKAGWLIYSPMLIFAIIGLFFLKKQVSVAFWAVLLHSLLFMYITWAWDIWWYGGSLGQRAMVQSYPVWAFPLAACIAWFRAKNWGQIAFPLLAGFFIWHNMWWTHQAHLGGLYVTEQMTKYYWLRVWGRETATRDDLKLLDTKDEYKSPHTAVAISWFQEDFEKDTTDAVSAEAPLIGAKSLIMNGKKQWSPVYDATYPPPESTPRWVRASCTFRCDQKEWDYWRMTQFIVRLYDGDQRISERMIRLQRHVDGSEVQTVQFDTRVPAGRHLTKASVQFWNADSDKTVRIDDVQLKIF